MFNICRCAARSVANHTASFSSLRFLPIAGYKSQYSIDKLYPNSNPDFASNPVFKHTQAEESEFTGFIPVETLSIKYTRGSGPGGQHVNKVNTKVEVRFHVDSASWIPESVRPKLHELEASRITKDGWLVVTSDKTRKQLLNQADCLDKIRVLVRNASKKPYEPTEEDMAVLQARREKARKAMLREKREHSLKKFSRSKPTMHDV